MNQLIVCLLVLIAFCYKATSDYQNIQYYQGESCSGDFTYSISSNSGFCLQLGCIGGLGLFYKTTCTAKLPDAPKESLVLWNYNTGDCSGDPQTYTVTKGCYITTKSTCVNNMYTITSCTGSSTSNLTTNIPTGNCTGFGGVSYKYTCGGIINMPNFFFTLLALLAVSLGFF